MLADKPVGDLTQRRRAVDLQRRRFAIAMVPAGQHHPRVVHDVVVVIVREEQVRDVGCFVPGFEQPVVRTRTMIDDDHVAARIEEIAGALPAQRGRRCPGPEQKQFHRNLRPKRQLEAARACILRARQQH